MNRKNIISLLIFVVLVLGVPGAQPAAAILEQAPAIQFKFLYPTYNASNLNSSDNIAASAVGLPNILLYRPEVHNSNEPFKPLRYSPDGGSTWITVPTIMVNGVSLRSDSYTIVRRPDNTPRILASVIEHKYSTSDQTDIGPLLFRSGNYGTSWVAANLPFNDQVRSTCSYPNLESIDFYVSDIWHSPTAGNRLYLSLRCVVWAGFNNVSTTGAFLYTSEDAGENWIFRGETFSGARYSKTPHKVMVSPILPQRVYQLRVVEDDLQNTPADNHWERSDDAGQTWTPLTNPDPNSPPSTQNNLVGSDLVLDAQDPNIVYTNRYRSTDGGVSWVQYASHACQSSLIADLVISGTLYCLSDNGMYVSQNRGDTWEKRSDWSGVWLQPDLGNPGRILWGRSDGLWASTDQGQTWDHLTSNYTARPFTPWENVTTPDFSSSYHYNDPATAFVAHDRVWSITDRAIGYWNGTEWIKLANTNTFKTADFLPSGSGWFGGSEQYIPSGILQGWNGEAFTEKYTVDTPVYRVDVVSDQDAWAIGNSDYASSTELFAKIYHWDGNAWNETFRLSGEHLRGIEMVSPDEGWAYGQYGPILWWHNGNWRGLPEMDPSSEYFNIYNDMEVLSPSDGWLVGSRCYTDNTCESVIFHWDGNNWQSISYPKITELYSVSFKSADDGWAVGKGLDGKLGVLLHWDGTQWTDAILRGLPFSDSPEPYPVSAFEVGSDELWFVDTHSHIFRYRDTGTYYESFMPVMKNSWNN